MVDSLERMLSHGDDEKCVNDADEPNIFLRIELLHQG